MGQSEVIQQTRRVNDRLREEIRSLKRENQILLAAVVFIAEATEDMDASRMRGRAKEAVSKAYG